NKRIVYYMTTKKMLSQGKFKEMEENETIVEDKKAAEGIFASLGLVLKESINKYRESYKILDSLVEIDINDTSFCPFPYIEIETDSEEKLEKIVKLLGYTMEDTTSKTIYELVAEDKNTQGI
nr:CYTH domain-containing protein [Clostridium sp.]